MNVIEPVATGAQLRAIRQRKLFLTQAQLAQKLGRHRDTVQAWEKGNLTIAHPVELALALESLVRGVTVAVPEGE